MSSRIQPGINLRICVNLLAQQRDFYIRVFGMNELRRYNLSFIDEIMVGFEGEPSRGSNITLMFWKDGSARNYKDNPVKLVYYTLDAVALADRLAKRATRSLVSQSRCAAVVMCWWDLPKILTATSSNFCRCLIDRVCVEPQLQALGEKG
jgi:hypothetical protein